MSVDGPTEVESPTDPPAPRSEPPRPRPRGQRLRRLATRSETGLAVALLLLCLLLAWRTPNFATPANLFVVARQVSLIGIIAVGMTFVILTSGIDLSVGSVVALVSVVFGIVVVQLGLPWPVGVAAALAVGAGVGALNGALIVATGVPAFIVTLGMLGVARGFALGLTEGATISGLPSAFFFLGQGRWFGVPVPVWIFAVLALAAHVVLSRTRLGRHVYFVGSNREAARLSGVRVRGVTVFVFTVAGLCAAIEAVVETSRLSVAQPGAGVGYELLAIGAVIIGGTSLFGGSGTILGTVLGATLLGLITNGLILLGISAFWQQAFSGAVIIVAVTVNTLRQRT